MVAVAGVATLGAREAGLTIAGLLVGLAGVGILPLWVAVPAAPMGPAAAFLSTTFAILLVGAVAGVAAQARARQVALHRDALEALRTANVELRRKRAEAEAADEAKSAFLAAMSHEMRTPLNGVLGMAQLLREGRLDPEQREHLQILHGSARLLLTVIDDLLDVSKLDAGQVELDPVPFRVRAWAREGVELLRPRAREAGLDLELVVSDRVPRAVEADDVRLRQVLLNLVGNAVKFTERGRVVVRIDGTLQPGGRVALLIEVEDTGIGIPEDALEVIFDRFTQAESDTTRRFGGTGLGLAIVKGLVEAMGGRVGVESTVGVGSRFWVAVTVPVAQEATRPPTLVPLVDVSACTLRVLVVDDHAVNRTVARRMVERLGHEVVEVDSGAAAVARAAEGGLDVVLMDVEMPGMDGLEATRRIRALPGGSSLPIVALTAHALPAQVERCLAAGMDAHLAKPLMLDALETALERAAAACCPEEVPAAVRRAAGGGSD